VQFQTTSKLICPAKSLKVLEKIYNTGSKRSFAAIGAEILELF